MLKIGHRGAKGYRPENTLASFQYAVDIKADGIELDVHISADKELIVIHDETTDRTTNTKGVVTTLTLSDLKKITIEHQYEIPTLQEVLALIDKRCFVNIELKGAGTTEKTVAIIEQHIHEKNWCYDHFIISSFNWNALQEVALLNPNIRLGVLTETDLGLACAFAKFIKAYSIHPYFHLLNAKNTAQLQEKGFLVFPWTVNEAEDLQTMRDYTVDGIISDYPDRI
ncbi:MAG TPA: glycerophosphodiester phosphodiesterase family protein [Flavobacterium sp.]|jgi:glycerophosphoryl diester phosphodiesterase